MKISYFYRWVIVFILFFLMIPARLLKADPCSDCEDSYREAENADLLLF